MKNITIALSTLSLVTFSLLAVSCSSSSSPSNPGGPTDSGTGGNDGLALDTGGGDSDICDPTTTDPPPAPGAICVRHVTGKVVDEKGAGVDKLVVTVCGAVTCFYGHSDAASGGAFDVGIDSLQTWPGTFNVIVHGGVNNASSYNPVPTLDATGFGKLSKAIVAPTFDQVGPALPADNAGGTISAGNLTLTIPNTAAFELDPDVVAAGDDGRKLRLVKWTDMTNLPLFAAGSNVAQLVALGPFASKSCHASPCASGDAGVKIAVSMTNDASLPSGAAVEFLTLGIDLTGHPFVAGEMNVVANGHVSADGKTIDTDTGEGITTITWLGVRKKG